ncbi:MAG: hypothetical protein ACUVV5_08605 [Candidatus Aminicenantales bacterium]
MIKKKYHLFLFCLLFLMMATRLLAINTGAGDAELSGPGLDKITFFYAGDLWTADLDGKNPRQMTVEADVVNMPVFSPDGK